MQWRQYIFYVVVLWSMANASFASDRTLDAPCRYSLTTDGKNPTYRELLVEVLARYKQAYDTSDQVVPTLENAMAFFGTGPKDPTLFKQKNPSFNYTTFYRCKERLYDDISQSGFELPFKNSPQALRDGVSFYFDIRYALFGVLQYNAYCTTGGDS